jgi:hypothetical protein
MATPALPNIPIEQIESILGNLKQDILSKLKSIPFSQEELNSVINNLKTEVMDKIKSSKLNLEQLQTYLESQKNEILEKVQNNPITNITQNLTDRVNTMVERIKGYSLMGGLLYVLLLILLFYIIYLVSKK